MSEAADGGYAELVAAPDSESEAVAGELRLVRDGAGDRYGVSQVLFREGAAAVSAHC